MSGLVETISTPVTKMFGIKHPIILAGMNVAAGPELAAAVTNYGGLGVIGGVGYTPQMLQKNIDDLKANLKDKNAPFGVDLLLPKVGEGARPTNYDYTGGQLYELVDIIIKNGAKLFVSAVGVPPKAVVDKLHAAGIPVMNMIGAPKHVQYAIDAGCDLICAQGGEGGGHTGDVATSILIPKVVDICRGQKSPLTGEAIHVIAAGGIFDGRGLASALSYGAAAVWVGTRFVACEEAGAPPRHKQGIVKAGFHDTLRTIIYTGRPMRVIKSDYINEWETNKASEIKDLTTKGKIPVAWDMDTRKDRGLEDLSIAQVQPLLSGQAAGAIDNILPAAAIMDEMIVGAIAALRGATASISKL